MPNDKPKQSGQPASAPAPASDQEESLDVPAGAAQAPPPAPAAPQPPGGTPAEPPAPGAGPAKRDSPLSFLQSHLYIIVFALLVLAGAVVLYVSFKTGKPQTSNNSVTSLTDQQLSTLKGNTTLVGDAKQTLDVQSNSIFEGQVLLRSDLNVAGALKVGQSLSLPSITVGNKGTFGELGISGGLNVGKDTTIQGQLTVKGNLSVSGTASFGALDVASLSVTSLNIRGNLNFSQHLVPSGGIPSRSGGTALGGGGTVSLSGTDTAGSITINTGSGAPAGCFVTVNFTHQFNATPYVVISPANSSAAGIDYYVTNRSASGFSVCTASPPGNGKNFVYTYIAIQ